jgi:hypothetical protein
MTEDFYIKEPYKIWFSVKINVSSDGLFTGVLPPEILQIADDSCIQLHMSKRGKRGYFSSDTLEGFKAQIRQFIADISSVKMVTEKLVLQYCISTRCLYVKDKKGQFFPNSYFLSNKDKTIQKIGRNARNSF